MTSLQVIAENNVLDIQPMGNRSIFEVDGESVLSLSSNVKQIDVNMNELVTFDGSTITIMDGSDISRTISSVNQFIFADGFTFHNVTAPLMEPIMNMFTLQAHNISSCEHAKSNV